MNRQRVFLVMAPTVTIEKHTTASTPRPHILYTVQVNLDGKDLITQRRYSEFVALHDSLNDPYNLPPKRLLATTFLPSAWVDDALIAERKSGLSEYLLGILSTQKYKDQAIVFEFLSANTSERAQRFDLEDALPSTLTRTKALNLTSMSVDGSVDANAVLVAGGYYPSWSVSTNSPESIDFSKFDTLCFAFAVPSSSSTVSLSSSDQAIMKRLVTAARNSGFGTRVVLSIGGWGGCYYYSQACSTSANRTKFANSIAAMINTYNLDGVDLDWEYPNSAGAGQPFSTADTANLLSLVKLLRTTLGPCKIISAAVAHQPWLGANGKPLTDVSAFAAVMSYVTIMNYDVWGASATPGPNAPLGDLCKTSTQPSASAQAAFATWTTAKFPANQLILGLPLYGYVSNSSKTVLTGSSVSTKEMHVLQEVEVKDEDSTTTHFLNGAHANNLAKVADIKTEAAAANLTAYWGQQIAFKDIVKAGALAKKSDGNYGQAGGFTMAWDNCSDTPYLYNKAQTTVVTYDDTYSLTDKAKYAKTSGMAGCMTWSIDQDDGLTLQKSIRKALGKT